MASLPFEQVLLDLDSFTDLRTRSFDASFPRKTSAGVTSDGYSIPVGQSKVKELPLEDTQTYCGGDPALCVGTERLT